MQFRHFHRVVVDVFLTKPRHQDDRQGNPPWSHIPAWLGQNIQGVIHDTKRNKKQRERQQDCGDRFDPGMAIRMILISHFITLPDRHQHHAVCDEIGY